MTHTPLTPEHPDAGDQSPEHDPAAADSGTPVARTGSTSVSAADAAEVAPVAPDEADPLTSAERTEELRSCPGCGGLTGAGSFCEACGSEVAEQADAGAGAQPAAGGGAGDATTAPAEASPAAAPERSGGMLVLGAPTPPPAEPASDPVAEGPRCRCGGGFQDGYCEQCGAPLPNPRDHVEEDAGWVAGVTDVGVRHRENQDAMALRVEQDRAALVVCDGVSTALRSEDASQAAADAAVTVLSRATSTGVGVPSSLVPALSSRLATAADAAADAVADITEAIHAEIEGDGAALSSHANPSCTFVAAAVESGHVVVGSVGDSRAYWFPDGEAALLLTTDDSVAEERIAQGTPRAEAETGPGAHTITRWLGVDSPDHSPRTRDIDADRPGWLIVCSDGLWNYASEPDVLAAVLADVATAALGDGDDAGDGGETDARPDPGETGPALTRIAPLLLARGLVTWANAKGGHDNITVIAARLHDARKAPSHG